MGCYQLSSQNYRVLQGVQQTIHATLQIGTMQMSRFMKQTGSAITQLDGKMQSVRDRESYRGLVWRTRRPWSMLHQHIVHVFLRLIFKLYLSANSRWIHQKGYICFKQFKYIHAKGLCVAASLYS